MTDRPILLNLTWLRPGRVGGTEAYCVGLLEALIDAGVPLTVAGRADFVDEHPRLLADVRRERLPSIAAGRGGRIAVAGRWLRSLEAGHAAIHHLGGTATAGTLPAVLTVYDLQYLAYPKFFHPLKRWYLQRATPASVARSEIVCAISDFAAQDLQRRLSIDPGRMVVVPPVIAAGAARRVVSEPEPVAAAGRPFVLYPAVTWPHKNHTTLVRAMADRRLDDLDLVLTGGTGPVHAQVMRDADRLLGTRVRHLGLVPRSQLESLYRTAAVVAFPSLYEAFGQPTLEALAHRCPVVAADAAALPEVVGGIASALVPPDDVDGWVRALRLTVDRGPGAIDEEAVAARLERYAPAEVAARQVEAYRLSGWRGALATG